MVDPAVRRWQRRVPQDAVLHRVVMLHLETFLRAIADDPGRAPLPRFVIQELRAFLDCGVLGRGFARVHCSRCGKDELVAFSCKGRGFCPSCGGRRMADIAAHLVDVVLPHVPVRQWVLSLPHRVRFLLAYDADVCRAVRAIFVRSVLAWIRARDTGAPKAAGAPCASCSAATPPCVWTRTSTRSSSMASSASMHLSSKPQLPAGGRRGSSPFRN